MSYYHVFIEIDGDEKEEPDLSKEELESLVKSYHKNEKFMCGGSFIQPSEIETIQIYETHVNLVTFFERNAPSLRFLVSDNFILEKYGRNVTKLFIKHPPRKRGTKKGLERERKTSKENMILSKNIFIVHGRDGKQALLLQKYLKDKLKVDAVMFDDLPDKGRTIIEQLEYIRDNVGYAFVIVTSDDVGCLREDIEELGKMLVGLKSVQAETVGKIFGMLHTRTRQNVVFELGLFMGALGREKVCCLLKRDIEEKLSDINGILYKLFSDSVSEIFHEILEELKEAGYEIKM